MKNLSDLLGKFTRSLNNDENIKKAVVDVVIEQVGVKIQTTDISFKEGVLEIQASAVAKNELKLKEERILGSLREVYKINVRRVLYR